MLVIYGLQPVCIVGTETDPYWNFLTWLGVDDFLGLVGPFRLLLLFGWFWAVLVYVLYTIEVPLAVFFVICIQIFVFAH